MMKRRSLNSQLCAAIVVFALVVFVSADEKSHRYEEGEVVKLWLNKVGPYYNPQETYLFYTLPYCKATEKVEERKEGLGEALEGNELINSGYKIGFKDQQPKTVLCTQILTDKDVTKFTEAVRKHYWYQMYLGNDETVTPNQIYHVTKDELPIWGMVGELVIPQSSSSNPDVYVYTHKRFSVGYNKDRIIEVNLTSEDPLLVKKDVKMPLSYSVNWIEVETPFEDRFDKYLDYNFFEHQIHWFSIFNSFMMVIFLAGLVSMILMRTLKKDYARYSREEEDGLELEHEAEESGWKQIHGDVFRSPEYLALFSSLIGVGCQLVVLVFFVIVISIVGTLYKGRGSITTAFIVCYALTSFIGGYVSGSHYMKHQGKNWIKNLLLTACIFPGFCLSIGLFLNIIALSYHSLATIPLGTLVAIFMIWAVISFPLTVGGTILGRNLAGQPNFPCRINQVARPIPDKQWYLQPAFIIMTGGILPFGSIFIEMYFIFSSFWNYKFYYVYGFMLLVYIILIIVTICVTIVSSYFLLNSEDYRWPWVSYLSAASTSVYVFLYAIYYFFSKTRMFGFFQTMFYFGYTGIFCFGLALVCGTIGYIGTSMFTSRIYRNIKVD